MIIIYKKNKKTIILKLILLLINLFVYDIKTISDIKISIMRLKAQFGFKKIEKYLRFCKGIKTLSKYKKIYNPKISIISPIYNSENYLLRFLKCIQNQTIKEIEIILIDDCSLDNSVKKIEDFQKNERRILLIKNKKNKGTFINRNLGFLFSKGKYIILPDPDDIISKNIINICFKYGKKYNYDIIRFNIYIGKKSILYNNLFNILNKPIFQPDLSTYISYGNNDLAFIDFNLCNKMIKKEVYSKALFILNKYFLNIYLTYSEDFLFNYFLYKAANSFFFIKEIGYYYIKNQLSITNNLFKKSKIMIEHYFILLKMFLEYSKFSKHEIDIVILYFSNIIKKYNIASYLLKYNKDFIFFHNIIIVIKAFINSKFITKENKKILFEYKKLIEKFNLK